MIGNPLRHKSKSIDGTQTGATKKKKAPYHTTSRSSISINYQNSTRNSFNFGLVHSNQHLYLIELQYPDSNLTIFLPSGLRITQANPDIAIIGLTIAANNYVVIYGRNNIQDSLT